MATTAVDIRKQAQAAKAASRELAKLSTEVKNRALLNVAQALEAHEADILAANQRDYDESRADGLGEEVLDKLLITPNRLQAMIEGVRGVAALPDPVGESFDVRVLPNGLQVGRRRVPLGVIAIIFEARPDVTTDIPSLCLKSGNAAFLRGGKEAINSNRTLATIFRDAIAGAGVTPECVQFVESTDRALVGDILRMREHIDLVVPRGGSGLIQFVAENATMPAITGGRGVCHIYVDRRADVDMAKSIVVSDKIRRPAACNAVDAVLVHRDIAEQALPVIGAELAGAGVELRCDDDSLAVLEAHNVSNTRPASPGDWGTEFLALVAAIKVVDSLDEALDHIQRYGTEHSEVIVTEDYAAAQRFLNEVEASAVLVNAGMGFNDGGQLGLGAEVVISTEKLPARGPIGLRELTSYKWTVLGSGQVRL